MVHPYHEIVFNNKKKSTIDTHSYLRNLQRIILCEKSQSQRVTCKRDFIYRKDNIIAMENRVMIIKV